MSGGVTWPSTQNLNSSTDDFVGNLLRMTDRTNS